MQSVMAWLWPQRLHGAVQPSVLWPKILQRLQLGVLHAVPKWPFWLQRAQTRRMPRYLHMTRCPAATLMKLDTTFVISKQTTLEPVNKVRRSLHTK